MLRRLSRELLHSANLIGTLLIFIVLGMGSQNGVEGQVTEASKQQLLKRIQAEAANLDLSRLPDWKTSRAEVLARIDAVERYLQRAATSENRSAWLRYLDLDPLVAALEQEEAWGETGRAAVELRYRLIGTDPGLELPEFVELRDAVEQLIDAIRFRDPDRTVRYLESQLESLSERTEALDENPSSSDMALISGILGRLASARQAASTVSEFTSVFSRPNLSIVVSEPLVQQVANQDIEQTNPVRDCILGTRIVGTATLDGSVSVDCVASSDSALLSLTLTGNVISHSTGYNGPVRLQSVGTGRVVSTQILRLGSSDFGTSAIEVLTGSTEGTLNTDIRRIEHPLKLVRKIARKRAAQQKPLAERIARGRMQNRVSRLFSEQIEQTIARAPERLNENRAILTRLSLDEPARAWSSTDESLLLDVTIRDRDQPLSAVMASPPISDPFGVAVQLHESVVNNLLSPVLAGRTLTEAKLNSLLGEIGRAPESASEDSVSDVSSEPDPPFEIDFAEVRPIVFAARNQEIRIGVRGTRFAQGGRELDRSLEITAVYRPNETEDGQWLLVRDEEIDVDFPGRGPLTLRQAGLRPTIKTKFEKVFPDKLLDRELKVPETSPIESLRGRVFEPAMVDANAGWFTIGFN